MKKILVIEDDPQSAGKLKAVLKARKDFECDTADSLKTARQKTRKNAHFLAVLNLDLAGEDEEKYLELFKSHDIPIIVYAREFNDEVRERMISQQVLDYVVKEDDQGLEYIVNTIERVYKNQSIKVIVVDDSRISRNQISRILQRLHNNQLVRGIVLDEKNSLLFYDMPLSGLHCAHFGSNSAIRWFCKNHCKPECASAANLTVNPDFATHKLHQLL